MDSIKKWRNNARLTQQSMADIMGIPKRTIEEWEGGRRKAPDYVERLVIKELKEITEKTIEKKMSKMMAKLPSDEYGNRPNGSWAIITTHNYDEFVELFDSMQEAIDEFSGKGYIGYIACNQLENGGKQAWYTDRKNNVCSDHEIIEI